MENRRQNSHLHLYRAIERADKRQARHLIRNGVGVNDVRSNNSSLLHSVIIKFNDLDIITMLLDKGANIHAKDHQNNEPFYVAIQNNKTAAALLLIEKGAIVDENLDLLLLTTIEKNNHSIFKILIDHKMQNNPSADLKTLFDAAISQGNPKIIEYLITHCRFLELTDKYIPIELVMKSGVQYKESIEFLLRQNFIINPDNYHDQDFIYAAVQNGHFQIVLQLLNFGIDVNMVNLNTGLDLLTIACLKKHHQIVENLLIHNANVNVTIPANYNVINHEKNFSNIIREFNNFLSSIDVEYYLSDVTCLHIAVFNSDSILTEILLRHDVKISNDSDFFFITCIAAQIGCKQIVRIFLDHGVNINVNDFQGQILLHSCVHSDFDKEYSSYNVVMLLLERGASVHLQTPGNTLVFNAINNGHHEIVQLFLNYHANVQYISPDGDTLLHKAIECDFGVRFITALLNLGLLVDAVNSSGLTPLFAACKIQLDKQFTIIETLLQHNANVNCTDISLRTPLHSACDAQNLRLAKILLEKGANPNAANDEGQTPLHSVCKFEDSLTLPIIELLLEHNANIEAVDAKGWTPLFVACNSRNDKAVKCLLDNNAYANHTDVQHLTPLHIAVEQKSTEMTRNLIKSGANINMLDKYAHTALLKAFELYRVLSSNRGNNHHLNRINNYKEIIKILKTQVVKLVVAELKVNVQNCNIVYNPGYTLDRGKNFAIDISQLSAECQQEVNQLKIENVGTDRLTFYDLLEKNIHFLCRFVSNDDIQKALKLQTYSEKYPLYIDIIRGRFQDAKVRYQLLILAREYFSENICQRLPDGCIDIVFNYLSVDDLKMFINTMKLSSG